MLTYNVSSIKIQCQLNIQHVDAMPLKNLVKWNVLSLNKYRPSVQILPDYDGCLQPIDMSKWSSCWLHSKYEVPVHFMQ